MKTVVIKVIFGVNLVNSLPNDAKEGSAGGGGCDQWFLGERKDEQACIRVAIRFYCGFY